MAPVFSHGDLRIYLLRLLAEEPRHGYDIIQALSERTGGTYTPSAGTVYPRLAKLEEEGLVSKTVDGRKTVYEITDAGRAELEARSGDLDDIEAGLADSVRLIADGVRASVRAAMKTLSADLATASAQAPDDSRGERDEDPSDPRVAGRAQIQRAESAINEFRGRVRADLRSFVAKGGTLEPAVVTSLVDALDAAAHDVVRQLHR